MTRYGNFLPPVKIMKTDNPVTGSIFNLYKIGAGPSSSHGIDPKRAARSATRCGRSSTRQRSGWSITWA